LLIVRDLGEPDKAAEFVVAVPLCAICPHELLELSRKISKNTAEKHDRCRREKVRKMRFWVIVVFIIKNLFIRFWVVLSVYLCHKAKFGIQVLAKILGN
jgi:hypothetical protein